MIRAGAARHARIYRPTFAETRLEKNDSEVSVTDVRQYVSTRAADLSVETRAFLLNVANAMDKRERRVHDMEERHFALMGELLKQATLLSAYGPA